MQQKLIGVKDRVTRLDFKRTEVQKLMGALRSTAVKLVIDPVTGPSRSCCFGRILSLRDTSAVLSPKLQINMDFPTPNEEEKGCTRASHANCVTQFSPKWVEVEEKGCARASHANCVTQFSPKWVEVEEKGCARASHACRTGPMRRAASASSSSNLAPVNAASRTAQDGVGTRWKPGSAPSCL